MAVVAVKNALSVSFGEKDVRDEIEKIESIAASLPQDYAALAVIVQQKIVPVIRTSTAVQSRIVSPEIAQSQSFVNPLREMPIESLDPAFLPFLDLDTNEIPFLANRTVDKVNMTSKVFFLVFRAGKDKSALEICEEAVTRFIGMQDSRKGLLNVIAKTWVGNTSRPFPRLTHSTEQHPPAIAQIIKEDFGQLEPTLDPRKGILVEKHFYHGETEETVVRLSSELQGKEIVTTQKRSSTFSGFTDLRYKAARCVTNL